MTNLVQMIKKLRLRDKKNIGMLLANEKHRFQKL